MRGLRGAIGRSALLGPGGRHEQHGFNAIVNPDNFSYNNDRDGYRERKRGE